MKNQSFFLNNFFNCIVTILKVYCCHPYVLWPCIISCHSQRKKHIEWILIEDLSNKNILILSTAADDIAVFLKNIQYISKSTFARGHNCFPEDMFAVQELKRHSHLARTTRSYIFQIQAINSSKNKKNNNWAQNSLITLKAWNERWFYIGI